MTDIDFTVPFEIAKLLKERGFDEKGAKCYNLQAKFACDFDISFNLNVSVLINRYEDLILAPTYKEVFNWLEKVHNIKMCYHTVYFDWEVNVWGGNLHYTVGRYNRYLHLAFKEVLKYVLTEKITK